MIAALPHVDHARPSDLLHMTMLGLWDATGDAPARVADLGRHLDAFRAPPFDLAFDRVRRRGRHVELVSTRRLAEAKTLRQLLVDHLVDRCGLPVRRPGKLRPHVTLHYASAGEPFDEWIDPLGWRVEEMLLIESVVGETRHVTLGRWALRGRAAAGYEFALPLFRAGISSASLQT